MASRVVSASPLDLVVSLWHGWQLVFSRNPTAPELVDALEFLSRQVGHLKSITEKTESAKKDEKIKPAEKPTPDLQALTDLCQILLSANEFLYVD